MGQTLAVYANPGAGRLATFGQYTIRAVAAQTLTLDPSDVLSSDLTRAPGTWAATLAASSWEVLNRDIRAVEFLGIAYDPLNNAVFGGTQDNGIAEQPSPLNGLDDDGDGAIDEEDERFAWREVRVAFRPGDGNTAAVAPVNTDADPAF